ncbi:hypothetical protein ACEWY4_018966 [Coilia grayii]|uniref:SRCR domain-containing protein n=1 Tax=Coilia grayii TaxID=363190 RepID=A0ABD1JER1_9TELE
MEEARVVCAQLGFRGALSAEPGGKFSAGSGSIWLDDLGCKGSEKFLSSCTFKDWGVTDCSHSEDAGVTCDVDPALNTSKSYSMDHSIELSDQMGELFDSGTGCDVNLTFSYPAEDLLELETQETPANNKKESICVHSLVLALFPKVVASNSNHEMEISSNCQRYIKEFVRYLYTRKITVSSASMQCLHQLASEFGTERLMEDIGRLFVPLLPEDSSFRTQVALFKYAVRSGDGQLRDNVLRYLGWNMEPLVASAQWKSITEELLMGLLVRSDMVLPDEAWLLGALDAWVLEHGDAVKPEHQAALLGHVRFPMMTPERLYELPFTSRLYSGHKELFHAGMLLGFEFHALDFSVLTRHMDNQSEQFQPRIYTASPWRVSFNVTNLSRYSTQIYNHYGGYSHYGERYGGKKSFNTPLPLTSTHSSKYISWVAEIFSTNQRCLSYGQCDNFSVQLQKTERQETFKFSNQLLLACRGSYVFHVQGLKNDDTSILNTSATPAPCPDGLIYQFVVRPQYILQH